MIEATAAIARLGLPVNLLTVVPATENMPSGHAIKPGDIISDLERQDGRGEQHRRRGPADPRRRARLRGGRGRRADRRPRDADRRDHHRARLAPTPGCSPTTTSCRAALERAGDSTGELVWRMPLHPDYKDLTRGKVADLIERLGGAQGVVRLRGLVPRGVRRRQAVGAPRHRGHRLGPGQPRLRRQGRDRLGRAAAGRAGARACRG